MHAVLAEFNKDYAATMMAEAYARWQLSSCPYAHARKVGSTPLFCMCHCHVCITQVDLERFGVAGTCKGAVDHLACQSALQMPVFGAGVVSMSTLYI